MGNKQEKLIVVVSESVVASLIKDLGTFILFAGLMYFNHKALSGSLLIDVLFIVMASLLLMGRSKSVFKGSRKDAIKWLEESNDE